ncbi:MAG: outer membrane lipoprotein-sorting protein, partial [Myxococcota bacterium]
LGLYEEDHEAIDLVKPKPEAGKGYLRVEKNMYMYDPKDGNWERRTERERLMGTDTRRADLDEWRLSENFTGRFIADEKLGRFSVHRIELTARDGARVPYPKMEIWVDVDSRNVLKRRDYALSGRLMRTAYYPKWRVVSAPSGREVAYPEQMRILDEVEQGNRTTVVITQLDLRDLDPNIFTKAWLESRSR